MPILPFLKNKKKSNKFLTIEIDNNQLKVLALYKELDGKFKVIGSSNKILPENTISNFYILDKKLLTNVLIEAVLEATVELEEDIKDVIFGVKGSQCIEITTTAKATSTHKRIIKEGDLDEVYNKITEAAYIQAQNDIVRTNGDYDAELEIILTSNVYFKIDGNFYDEPIGVEGEILECALFNAFCYKKDLKTINQIIKDAKLNLLAVAPIPYSLVQNISLSNQEEKEDYTLINISPDSTQIIIVFGKGLIDTKTLPLGHTQIIESFAHIMGLTTKESEKVTNSYILGQLKDEEEKVIQKCLNEVLYVWLEGVKLSFEEFSEIKTYANQIYITGEGSVLPDIIEMFNSNQWYKEIPFKTSPTCKKININDFSKIQDATGKINRIKWINTMALSIIYLEQEENND